MDKARELKRLKTEEKLLMVELGQKRAIISGAQKDINTITEKMDEIKKQQKAIEEQSAIVVTEHAMLRYLERVKGIDLAAIQKEIVSDQIRMQVQVLGGSGQYPNNGFAVVMKNYKVVTVIK